MRPFPFLAKLALGLALATAAPLLPTASHATDVYTDPVGFITLTVAGTNGISGQSQSFLGLGMARSVSACGIISGVSGTQITVNSSLNSGEYNQSTQGPRFFVEIASGANAGLMEDIVSNSAASVFIASDISSLVASGQTYKIFPHWTLASLFGASNETGFASTDRILVPNPATKNTAIYFYSTGGKPGVGWRSGTGGATDQSNVPLYLDQGIIVRRTTDPELKIKLVGSVKLGQTIIPISGYGTNTFVGNLYAASSMTLSNSQLYTGDSNTGLTAADRVLIQNAPGGQFTTYFWSLGGKPGVGWRSGTGGSTEMGNTPIPVGSSIVIQLGSGNSGFNWFAPEPYELQPLQ